MKKQLSLFAATVGLGLTAFTVNNLHAQNDLVPGTPPPAAATPIGTETPVTAPTAPTPPPPTLPVPGQPEPRFTPGMRRGGPAMMYRNAVATLKHTKNMLQHSNDDFDGHRQTALDAVDKAIAELEIVSKSAEAKVTGSAPNAAPAPAPAPANQ